MNVAVVVAVARRCQALYCRCCCCLMLLNCRADPCKSVSATNPYVEAKFENFLGYFNSKNGVQITQTAYVRLDNSILSDNRQHGAEWPGAQGGEIAGGWGEHNAVTNCLFVGMSGDDFYGLIQDHNGKIYDPLKPEDRIIDFMPSASGIETPAWHKLSVMNTTFANYGNVLMRTRPGLIVCSSVGPDKCVTSVDGCICGHRPWFNATMHALTAVAKSEHSFEGGGWEVRFKNITWVNAPNKVGWEWAHESVYVDLDGTFSGAGANTSVVPPTDFSMRSQNAPKNAIQVVFAVTIVSTLLSEGSLFHVCLSSPAPSMEHARKSSFLIPNLRMRLFILTTPNSWLKSSARIMAMQIILLHWR